MPISNPRKLSTSFRHLARVITAAAIVIFAAGAQAQSTVVVTNLNDSGPGSLRDAIANSTSGGTINFQTGLTGIIPLQTTLSICQTLTVQGPGASQITLSGQGTVTVLQLCAGANVILSGLTIANGSDVGSPSQGGAGIYNTGGTLQLKRCTISGNQSVKLGAGIANFGGTVLVQDSVFSKNSVGNEAGGGIYNTRGRLTVTGSTFSGNSSQGDGGGIYNDSGGDMAISNSTFSGNSAALSGSAIFTESTTAPTSLSNSTVANNSGPVAGYGIPGGAIFIYTGPFTMQGMLLASNAGGNCGVAHAGVVSQGYNVSDDNSCTALLTKPTDQNNVLPGAGLDPKGLADNGGPTPTIALEQTSPALDNIPVPSCTDTNGNQLTTDQRGISRPQGKACDSGAYELEQTTVPFASFTAQLVLSTHKLPGFALNANFTLGTTANGIHPLTESVTLTIANYTVVIPAGSFHQLWNSPQAPYAFDGTINGTKLGVLILTEGSNKYQLSAAGTPGNFAGAADPVPVSITIGDDAGIALVKAVILQ